MVQILEGNRQIYQNKCRSLPPILYLWKPLHMLQRLQRLERHPTLLKGPVLLVSIFVSVIKQVARINSIRICDQLLLKILTNEKRGGLAMVSRSPFKVFSLHFSNKSMQAPSGGRTKTTQRTLFLSFATNNCFPTSLGGGGRVFE